jgi:hypothetical protein
MHEHAKKALVIALLIVSAAIVPSLPTVAGSQTEVPSWHVQPQVRCSGRSGISCSVAKSEIGSRPIRMIARSRNGPQNPVTSRRAFSFRLISNPHLKDPYPPWGNMTGSWYRYACA